jgi:hypothetical protein
LKAQKKNILKVVLYSILLVSYLLGFIVVFNIRLVLGIGVYQGEKNFTVDINGNPCGLNVEIWARHRNELEHYYGYTLTAFSNGNVDLVGISNLSYTLRTASSIKQVVDQNLDPPIKSYSYDPNTITRLNGGDNLTINGYANIIFQVNNVNEMYQIPIHIGLFIALNGNSIDYEWGNISIWIDVIYLSLTLIPAMFLYRNIKRLRFEKWYNEEIESSDVHFLEILSRKKIYEDDA